MVKKLSIFIGVWLLSLFVFNSVTDGHGQEGLKSGSSNSPYLSSSSRGDGEFITLKVPETSYSPSPSITPNKTIYLMTIDNHYSESFAVNHDVLAYPPIPIRANYIERFPSAIDSYAQGNLITSLDQKIFTLLEELNMVGLIVLFFIIRVFYTSWYQDNRLQSPTRWPF